MRRYLLLILLLVSACAPVNHVYRVIDGDTFILDSGEHVRLICINTPEKGEPLYGEATEHLRSLVEDKIVTLESDSQDRDKYGRLLRYVYVDGISINKEMVSSGYAKILRIPPNTKHCDEY